MKLCCVCVYFFSLNRTNWQFFSLVNIDLNPHMKFLNLKPTGFEFQDSQDGPTDSSVDVLKKNVKSPKSQRSESVGESVVVRPFFKELMWKKSYQISVS